MWVIAEVCTACAALLEKEPAANADDATVRLGYETATARAALAAARTASGEPSTTP
ncbi:hypothetical protein [Streptomyces sp. NPDC008001]|uniref:hypothetical protein n=1 Tax=Streptomyces sp. NPDC008001 TaxID=3364804 RepID=UPI0036E67154